jgi:uncharacterized protein
VATEPLLGGLSRENWDQLAGDHFYSTSAWLDLCVAEYDGVSDAAVVRNDQGEPVCAVPVTALADLNLQTWSRYRWNDVLAAAELPLLPADGMLVGPPEGFQTHVLGCLDADPVDRLLAEVRALRVPGGRPGGDTRVAMYLATGDVLALRQAGLTAPPVLLEADAWIEVPAGGWPAWLASRSKHRRDKIRQEVRKFQQAGYKTEHMPLSDCYEQLAWPAAATLQKYGFDADPAVELISLRRHVTCLGPLARVAVCSLGDSDPLGFCIYYHWGDTIYIRWAGFDYDRLAGAAEYFNLLFYEQIKQAGALGVRRIHAGVAATEAKVHRGAHLLPLWLVDMSPHSVLERESDRIHAHNRRLYERFASDPRTTGAITDVEAWQALL